MLQPGFAMIRKAREMSTSFCRPPDVTARGRLPLLGHLVQLALPNRMAFFQSLRSQGPVVQIYLGTKPAYVINSPEAFRQLLQIQTHKSTKGRLFEKTRPFIGNGIVTSDGDVHRRQRRIMQPAFQRQRIARYVDRVSDVAAEHAESWRSGEVVEVHPSMQRLAGALLSNVLFSGEQARDMALAMGQSLPAIVNGVTWRTLVPGDVVRHLPAFGIGRFEAAREKVWRAAENLIRSYRAGAGNRDDLLSLLMEAPDPHTGQLMSDDQLRDEIITIFLAGMETMTTTFSWTIHILSSRPHITLRLQEEADQVLGGRRVGRQDPPNMPYTGAVINELLRFYAPNFLLMRKATEPIVIEGTHIPPGAEIIYSLSTLHRDPHLYQNSEKFDPDRWIGSEVSPLRYSFIPFGAGNRQCIGDWFARTEMQVVLPALAANWHFERTRPNHIREVTGLVLHPPNRMAVRVTTRTAPARPATMRR